MATPPTATEQALRKLEDQLTCGICLDSCTEPAAVFPRVLQTVWSDLWYEITRGYPFIAPAAVDPPSSQQLVFQACKMHFISTISLRSETP